MVTGLLPVANVAPSVTNSDYLQTIGGVTTWVTQTQDTTFVGNGLVRRPDPLSNNDTLYLGYSKRDSASLSFNTFVALNSKSFTFTQSASNIFKIAPDIALNSKSFTFTQSASNIFKIAPDSLYIGTTLSGASTGYVWTLKDPTTGSGYWAVTGGGTFPTLQQVFNTEVGGSVLTKGDTILLSGETLSIQQNGVDWVSLDPTDSLIQFYANNADNSIASGISLFANNSGTTTQVALDSRNDNSTSEAHLIVDGNTQTIIVEGQLVLFTQFTPANSTDATYPNLTLSADNSFLYYRKNNGTWVKIAWTVF
jgi:hypothetical protein